MTDAIAPRHLGRSAFAIVAGFLAVAVLSIATDALLHALAVYPPWGEPMHDPGLNALALSYRFVYTVLGGWLTARLAPSAPMTHVLILGGIGFVLSGAGYFGTAGMDLGPRWMPLVLWLTSLPLTWAGGKLYRKA